jgi:hypothetical protein
LKSSSKVLWKSQLSAPWSFARLPANDSCNDETKAGQSKLAGEKRLGGRARDIVQDRATTEPSQSIQKHIGKPKEEAALDDG